MRLFGILQPLPKGDPMQFSTKATLLTLTTSTLLLAACIKKPADNTVKNVAESQEMAMAIQNDTPLKCMITDSSGTTIEYAVKGQKMRMTIPQEDSLSYMINDGEYVYMWEEGATEGIKNRILSEDELTETAEQMEDYTTDLPDFYNEEAISEYEDTGHTVDCQKDSFGDELFMTPQGVTFVSLEEKMQEAFDGMQKSVEGVPNIELPTEANGMMPPR